jgi:hypothetical protein
MLAEKNNFLILAFQQKEEYSGWCTDPELKGKVLPLRDINFKISAFQEAKGINHKNHVNIFFNDFGCSFGRMYAQRLAEDVEQKGSQKLPEGLNLPWVIFMEELEEFHLGSGYVENRYRESMIYAGRQVKNCFGDSFDYYQSDMLDRLYDWSGLATITINVPIAASTFFITTIIRYFQQKSRIIFECGGCPKPIIYIIEDATILADENELGGNTSPLVHMSFISRIYNQGFVFVSHNISASFSKKLLSNLESIAVFGISEPPRIIQDLLICSNPQAQKASILKPGEFITLLPSFHPQAIYGQFPYVKPPRKLTESEREDIIGPFLETVKAKKYIDKQLPAVISNPQSSVTPNSIPNVDSEELKFLVLAGTGKRLTVTQIYQQMAVSRRRGKKIFDRLERKALARPKAFGRVIFPEVLNLGTQIIESRGFKKQEEKGGGFDHSVGIDLIEAYERKKVNSFTREFDCFGKRLDGKATNPKTGQSIFYNVGVSDPVREAENLVEIAKMPVVKQNMLVFVARDAGFAVQVRKLLLAKDPSGEILKQVEIKTIADFVEM